MPWQEAVENHFLFICLEKMSTCAVGISDSDGAAWRMNQEDDPNLVAVVGCNLPDVEDLETTYDWATME